MPFRFKKAKKENQPLVVYLGGGGTVGCDNNKLLHEFLCYAKGKSDKQIAAEGLQKMETYMEELGLTMHLKELGVTEEMLPGNR